MKVLLSERNFKGHRRTYMECISEIPGIEFYILAPEKMGAENDHYIRCSPMEDVKSFREYRSWVNQMKDIVAQKGIDIVHILDGDSIMRWFGWGLTFPKAKQTVITYHHFFSGYMRLISYRRMCKDENKICVAHTVSVEQSLKNYGIKNVVRCEYPAFSFNSISSKESVVCKMKYGLPINTPTIGIVGGMSTYKNIIPFLETMRDCKRDFHILICGKESGITENQIKNAIKPYADKVTLILRQLSDEEYMDAIVASDIIFCIYGHEFDGASGPLTDGVCAKKMILSCKHGSLGEIVSQNLLGITAECSDRLEMLEQTELALARVRDFRYGEMAKKYRKGLNPHVFQNIYRNIYFQLWR